MIIKLLNFISGYVYVEVYGEKKERFINLCRQRQACAWNVRDIEDGYGFYIYARDFKILKEIARKTRMRVRIKERYGLPFLLFRHRKRKAFVLGIMTAFVIVYIMSLFIWDISVDGNYSYTKYEIMQFLQENNVSHGMKKADVDCEKIEKLVRNNYFDITWVSVELTGTRIIVHIRENFDDVDTESISGDTVEDGKGYMLVAEKNAVIESIITRSGVPMVKAGDSVEAGAVLIDGKYNVTGDFDELIRTEYVKADGDIYGYVIYPYSETLNREYTLRKYTGDTYTYRRLRVNDKAADLSIMGIDFENYDKIETEKQISIVGDFFVPVYFSEITCREYENSQVDYSDEELNEMAERKLSVFLENLSEKGIQIIENNVKIEISTAGVTASGDIKVIEKIGRLEPVPIITEETDKSNE